MQSDTNEITAQSIFDKTVNHLRQQGCRAVNEVTGDCLYRAPNGRKCAFGVHITDEEYRPEMENKTAYGMIVSQYRHLFPSLHRFEPVIVLIQDLQELHDNNNPSRWEQLFQQVARRHNLLYTAPAKK